MSYMPIEPGAYPTASSIGDALEHLQGGTMDWGITPFVKGTNGAYSTTAAPAEFVEFERAGHFAWTELNPEFQHGIAMYSIAFLDKYMKGDGAADPTVKLAGVSEVRSK
jgi:hypothetical protein